MSPGRLTFVLKELSTNSEKTLWDLSRSSTLTANFEWTYGSFALYASGPYELLIRGVAGSGDAESIVALDDLFFRESTYCAVEPAEAKTGQSLPQPPSIMMLATPLINPDANRSVYDCDFEDGLCNWTSDDTSERKWLRHQGYTRSNLLNKPAVDHTYVPLIIDILHFNILFD